MKKNLFFKTSSQRESLFKLNFISLLALSILFSNTIFSQGKASKQLIPQNSQLAQVVSFPNNQANVAGNVLWSNNLGLSKNKAFIENAGQVIDLDEVNNKNVKFVFEDNDRLKVYFLDNKVFYKISKDVRVSDEEYERAERKSNAVKDEDKDLGKKEKEGPKYLTKTKLVEMNWEGSNSNLNPAGNDPTSYYFNYYMPTELDHNRVLGNVKGYNKIVYENVYPHIDIEYTIHPQDGIKYSYILHPGADPSVIKMNYAGASVKKDGNNIIISTNLGDITDHAPLTYRGIEQSGEVVESKFDLINNESVGFKLANGITNISETTVIDPWQVGPSFPVGNTGLTPNDVTVDGSGNVFVYSFKPKPNPVSTSQQRIDKYSPAGVFQWTFDLDANANYVNDAQGDVKADPAGNVYVCIGLGQSSTTYYNTIKINPAGTALLWGTSTGSVSANNMYESWTITFNCDYTKFYQSGGGIRTPGAFGTTYFNTSVEEPVNATTGVEGTLVENDTLGEIIDTYWAGNGLIYHMAADSNSGANRTGAATTGAKNTLTCINPVSGVRLFRVRTGYSYVDGDAKAPGSIGINGIGSAFNYVYTTNGAKLDRWDNNTGAHFNQVTITGGSTTAGSVNSGILTDKCGNVYVGGNGKIYVYDQNLVLINTITGLPGIVFDMAWGQNSDIIACGGTSNSTTFLASIAIAPCTLPASFGVTVTTVQPTCASPTGSATATATFFGAPYTYLWSDGQTTQTATNLAPGTYTVTVSSSVSCPYSYSVASNTVTINPPAGSSTVTVPANSTVCPNATIPATSFTSTPAGATFTWTNSNTAIGLAASGSGNIASFTALNATSSPITATITVTPTSAGCPGTPSSYTITVNPNATITLTSAAATTSQTVCINNAITNITYSIGGGGTGATVSGLPAGVTGSFAGGVFTISGTPTTIVGSPFTYTVTTTGTCTQTTATGTITVNPNAAIALTSAAGTNAQIKCINTAITNITYSISGGGTGATVSGLPAGVTGSFAGGVFTISGTPTTTVGSPFTYTVTTTGICTQTTATGTITVNPNATITLTSAAATTAQTVCVNTAITNITYTVAGGGTGAGVAGLPAGVTGSFAGGVFTISGTPTTAVGSPFTYTVTTTGTCAQVTATGTITVNPLPVITSVPFTNETTCGANDGTITINATGTGLTYSINGGASFVATNSFTGLTAGSYSIVVKNSAGCTVSGGVISISSAGAPAMPTANATPNPLCAGATLTLSVTAPVGGQTYTWSGPGGYSPAGNGTGTQTILNVTTAMTGVYTVTASVGGCVSPGGSVTVTVNPNAAIALTSAAGTNAQTLCINNAITTITYSITGGGTGGTVTGLPAGVTGSFAGGIFTISGTPTVSGSFPYTVNTTGTCTQTSASGTITVNPNATIALTSAAATTSQTLCVNTAITNITYSVAGGGTGATVSGLPAGVTGSFAAGVFTISGTPSVTGTFPYTVNTTGTCVQTSASGTITINPNATISLTSAAATTSQSLCINTAITNITYSIGGGGTGATVSGLPAGVTGSYAGGVFTISGTPTVSGTFPYTVNTTGTCVQTSASGTITVNPDAGIVLTSAGGTDAQIICTNTAITDITYSVTGGGTGAIVSGLPSGLTGSFAAGVFTISGTTSSTIGSPFTYTITTTGTCNQTTATGTITVNPDAAIALSSAAGTDAQIVCENTVITDITYSITGGGTGASIAGLPVGVTGSFAGGVFTISGTPTTSIGSPFTYTVTTTGSCAQTSATGTITVNSDAAIALTSAAGTDAQTVCENSPITDITYSVTGGGTGASVSGLPAGVTGSFAGGVFTISGTPTTSVGSPFTYTVTTTGSCAQTSSTGTITVNPDAAIALTSAAGTDAQSVCENTAITDITYSVTGGGTGASVTGLPSGVTGSFAGGVFTINGTPTTSVGSPFTYTVTTTGSCAQTSSTGTITVNPDAAIALSSAAGTDAQSVCENTAITDIAYSVTGGGTGASVLGLPAGVTGSFAGGVFTISGTPTTSVGSPFTYTVTTTGSCAQTSSTGTITVNPDAAIALTSAAGTDAQSVCENSAITDITYSVTGGGTGASVIGLPAGVTGSFVAGVFTISGSPTASVGSPFVYTVTTTGTCTQTIANGTITVNPNAAIALTSAAGTDAQSVCENTAITDITYSVTGGGTGASVIGLPAGVTGSFVAGVFTISGSPTASVGSPFVYTVTTTGTCTQTIANGTITVNAIPIANAGPDATFPCSASVLSLDGSLSTTGVTYSWSGAGIASGNNTAAPTINSAGTYTLTVTLNGCSATDNVVISGAPGAIASFTANPLSGIHPLIVDFTNTSQNSNTYVWNFGDGSLPVSVLNPTEIYNTSGTYTAMLIASDFGQCPDTAYATIVVQDDFSMMIPNVFTPNGDNNNDVFKVTATGIESLKGAIYDRWGLKLFEWDGVSEGWDGRTSSGMESVDGTYYYILTVKGIDKKERAPLTGYILLLR